MIEALLFTAFAVTAVTFALGVVFRRNAVHCALHLVGVLLALSGMFVLLNAQFIAAVQILVYAGAIMVLVVFVIMLLNVEEEERRRTRLAYLVPVAVFFAAVLIAEVMFVLYAVPIQAARDNTSNVGLTASIGAGLFTTYLLPFEVTSILLLMAIVGAMTLARRVANVSAVNRLGSAEQSVKVKPDSNRQLAIGNRQ